MMNPDTGVDEKFQAVMTDLLSGSHITQTDKDTDGLYRELTDNEKESTEEF